MGFHASQKDLADQQTAKQVAELVALVIAALHGLPFAAEFSQMLLSKSVLAAEQVQLVFRLVEELPQHKNLN